jgi:hypothetical protein
VDAGQQGQRVPEPNQRPKTQPETMDSKINSRHFSQRQERIRADSAKYDLGQHLREALRSRSRGISQEEAANRAGIGRQRLRRFQLVEVFFHPLSRVLLLFCITCTDSIRFSALQRLEHSRSLMPKSGAPRKVAPEVLVAVEQQTRSRARAGNAVFAHDIPRLIEETRRSTRSNPQDELPPVSRSTLYRARKELNLAEVLADTQTQTRAAAKADLRNSISLCAVAQTCLEGVPPELTFCFDEVSFYLENNKNPVVVLPRDLVAELKDAHQSVKVAGAKRQRRVASLLNIIARDGRMLHTAVRIKDIGITRLSEHVISQKLSVWLYPPGTKEPLFVGRLFRRQIVPLLCEKRLAHASEVLAGPEVLLSGNLPAFVEQNEAAIASRAVDTRTCLCMDGDAPQTQAFLDGNLGLVCSAQNIEYLKFAAGCSGHESPLDLAKSHQLMRQTLHGHQYDYETDPMPSFAMKQFIQHVLNKSPIAPASRHTFRKFLTHLETILDKTFNAKDLQHGWQLAGFCPPSYPTILSLCSAWGELGATQAQGIFSAIPPLVEIVRLRGELTDTEIQDAVGDAFDFGPPTVNPLGAVNRRRSLWGNNEGFLAAYKAQKEAQVLARQEAQHKREERAANKKRKAEKAADKENKPPSAKRTKVTAVAASSCANPVCPAVWSKESDAGQKWRGCDHCDSWFCPKPGCQGLISKHESICQFR